MAIDAKEALVRNAVKMACSMFGISSEQIQSDIVKAAYAVLTFDTRLADIERNQHEIAAALKLKLGEISYDGNDNRNAGGSTGGERGERSAEQSQSGGK